jgi:hypothetical protein
VAVLGSGECSAPTSQRGRTDDQAGADMS